MDVPPVSREQERRKVGSEGSNEGPIVRWPSFLVDHSRYVSVRLLLMPVSEPLNPSL